MKRICLVNIFCIVVNILGAGSTAQAEAGLFEWQGRCNEVAMHVRGAGVVKVISPYTEPGVRAPRSVLILPPMGGANPVDMMYADSLCQKGIETWVVTGWGRGIGDYALGVDLESHDRLASRTLAAIRQITRQMPGRVGVLGTSAGAMAGAVALAEDARIRMGVLIAPGADFATIAATSDSESMERLRDQRMRAHNWSVDQYLSELRKAIHVDPIHMGAQLRRKRIGTVVALQDSTIPSRQQVLFERISGARRLATYNDGHTFSIIRAGVFDFDVVENFFVRNL